MRLMTSFLVLFPKVTDTSEGTQRMTDTSKYTGTHKLRFDEEGKGRGLAGRDSVAKGHGMSPGSVSSQQAYVSGYKHEGTYSLDKSSPKTEAKVHFVYNIDATYHI